MTSRVPTSSSGTQQPVTSQAPARSTRPQPSTAAPKPIHPTAPAPAKEVPLNTINKLWAGIDVDKSLELSMKDVQQRLAEEDVTNSGVADEAAALHEQLREQEAHETGKGALGRAWEGAKAQLGKLAGAPPKGQTGQQPAFRPGGGTGQQPAFRPGGGTGQQPAFKPGGGTGQQPAFRAGGTGQQPAFRAGATGAQGAHKPGASTAAHAAHQPTSASASSLRAVAQSKLTGAARSDRLPDAFTLLKDARAAGELFVEHENGGGHAEDAEDPELAAAVEECIRRCFGVRGILRVGPGHNDAREPIIVVTVTHGFSEGSMALVPAEVHRFPTLLAIPFELLPLKRDR